MEASCSSATLGTGGPGYDFASENLPTAGSSGSVVYKAGTIAMANSGGATNGSQFFLVFKNTTLGPDYTPFGTITSGLDILQNVAKAWHFLHIRGCRRWRSEGEGRHRQREHQQDLTDKKS